MFLCYYYQDKLITEMQKKHPEKPHKNGFFGCFALCYLTAVRKLSSRNPELCAYG